MAEVDLEQLKHRLASLGVHLNTPAAKQPLPSPAEARAWTSPGLDKGRQEVAELLDRCERVEAALHIVGAAESTALSDGAAALLSSHDRPTSKPARPPSSSKPYQPQRPTAAHAAAVMSTIAPPRAKQVAAAPSARQQPLLATSLAASSTGQHGPAGFTSKTSPLAAVLAQYKEAETAWLQEKAELRREAAAQRKRANKAELELKRLERLHAHQSLDVQALKAALKGRDEQLQEVDARAARLGEMVQKTNEVAAEKLAALQAERDDLKTLLMATLRRLEAVDEVTQRADVSTTVMEEKVKALEGERQAAIQAAARAEAEAHELAESKRRLEWQSQLLERMADVQAKHSRAKSGALQALLTAEAGGSEDVDRGDAAGEKDGSDPESPSLAAQLAALQQKYLG